MVLMILKLLSYTIISKYFALPVFVTAYPNILVALFTNMLLTRALRPPVKIT